MSVEAPPPPARLVLTTAVGPAEVAAAAATAAATSRGIFSSEVRQESVGPHGIDFLVTSPLAHHPSMRLRVAWREDAGSGLLVWLETNDVLLDEPVSPARAERTHVAVDRFAEVLEQLLAS